MIDVKFCGITRAADAALAAELGAGLVGVVFAESPRQVAAARAREIARAARAGGARSVGVFGGAPAAAVRDTAAEVGLDVVQLHGDAGGDDVLGMRGMFGGEIWGVLRVGTRLPPGAEALFASADGVLLDARSSSRLGGTGTTFDWERIAAAVAPLRDGTPARLIVAGGLHAGNVAAAIAALSPDVVDVSSGIEASPGVKDPGRMRAFMDAVRGSSLVRQR